MKNKFIITALFSAFLLIAPNVKAANFIDNQTVEANKTWTIKFTDDIGFSEVNRQGITVTNSEGALIGAGILLEQDRKTIRIIPPIEGYTVGESYTLNIAKNVHSMKGRALKKEYKLHFTIKSNTNNSDIVTFKDKALEQKIRDTINKSTGDILKSDVEKITTLYFHRYPTNDGGGYPYYNLQDISGIENLTNLQSLKLDNTQVTDISALKGLSNLQTLDLDNTQVTDISALEGLPNLQILDLEHTPISNISGLKNLPNLQAIYLSNSLVKNINGIENLPNLQIVYLNSSPVTDISGIKNLPNLKELYLGSTSVTDISALKGLANLQSLSLWNAPISDISALEGLNNLQYLNVFGTKVSDIIALKSLTNLKTLDLGNTQVTNIDVLKNLPNLQNLNLSENQISDTDKQSLKNALPNCKIYYQR